MSLEKILEKIELEAQAEVQKIVEEARQKGEAIKKEAEEKSRRAGRRNN